MYYGISRFHKDIFQNNLFKESLKLIIHQFHHKKNLLLIGYLHQLYQLCDSFKGELILYLP